MSSNPHNHRIFSASVWQPLCLSLIFCFAPPLYAEEMANIQIIAYNCFNCHGDNGASQGAAPPLKGLPAKYLQQTLNDYKIDQRPGTIMPRIAKGYTAAEINAVAEYFARFKIEATSAAP